MRSRISSRIRLRHLPALLPLFATIALLPGCGGDGGPTSTAISGVVATGAAQRNVTVTATQSNGITCGTATTGDDGSYVMQASCKPPFAVQSTISKDVVLTAPWISTTTAASTINLTPLTTALYTALTGTNGLKGLESVTEEQQSKQHAALIEVLKTLYPTASSGIDWTKVDLVTTPFKANSQGLDKVLDDTTIAPAGQGSFTFTNPSGTSGTVAPVVASTLTPTATPVTPTTDPATPTTDPATPTIDPAAPPPAGTYVGSVAVAPPAASSSLALFNLEGYAQTANVTGGGAIAESSANYCKVYTALDFANAFNNIKSSIKTPCKVIEIMNDLDLGWNEISAEAKAVNTGILQANNPSILPATTQTAMQAAGISLVNIQAFNGLTIFSQNGARIRHIEFNVKSGSNLIIRNLKFAEMWEWDDANASGSSKGDYDKNDWDFITLGDGGSGVTGVWIDHCTFTKSYDGIVDIKGAAKDKTGVYGPGTKGVTISWSEVVPESSAFMQHEFDQMEKDRANLPMYNYLRGYFTEAEIIQIATPQKKGSLVGANDLKESNVYTVTFHHDYFASLQDRMPRLRTGDVHVYNLYADEANNAIVKQMRDAKVNANPQLATDLSAGKGYHLNITSNGSISTEGGNLEVAKSVYLGVLTPLRNNQSDVNNPAYTGAIRAYDTMHILLQSDMPAASQQSVYTDALGTWATWRGDSSDTLSTLGPNEAPKITFKWGNGTPSYTAHMHEPTELKALLSGSTSKAGAGRVTMTTAQWLSPTN